MCKHYNDELLFETYFLRLLLQQLPGLNGSYLTIIRFFEILWVLSTIPEKKKNSVKDRANYLNVFILVVMTLMNWPNFSTFIFFLLTLHPVLLNLWHQMILFKHPGLLLILVFEFELQEVFGALVEQFLGVMETRKECTNADMKMLL